MQYPWTNIGSRMALLKSSVTFKHGTVIGCHLSNKSLRQVSALLELPRSTVSAVIVKWKRLGATTAQPLTTEFQTASGSNVITITISRELHEMSFHG